jgi:uncharacterized membrane protein
MNAKAQTPPLSPTGWMLVGVCMGLGLALRLASAQGGIWLDEAYSATFAHTVQTPFGVMFRINHDNNHHLNTLWLQLVGLGAPPLAMRALSILSGTAMIAVAAWVVSRAGMGPAVVAALLFAVSPFMTLYGSEARGYAPAMLAILVLIGLTQRWLEGEAPSRGALAAAVGIGTLAHLTTLPALAATVTWAWLERGGLRDWRTATRETFAAFDLALITALTLTVIILGGAHAVGGMVIGGYTPFSLAGFSDALVGLVNLGSGVGTYGRSIVIAAVAVLLVCVALARFRSDLGRKEVRLFVLLGAVMPLAVFCFQVGNSQIPRYFALSGVALLLYLGLKIGLLMEQKGMARWGGVALLAILLGGSALQDRSMIANDRGAPDLPLWFMRQINPVKATVLIADSRPRPVLEVAAAQMAYQLRIADTGCDIQADYYLQSHYALPLPRPRVAKCGVDWHLIAQHRSVGLSGESWALYAREGLQSPGGVANGLPPAR